MHLCSVCGPLDYTYYMVLFFTQGPLHGYSSEVVNNYYCDRANEKILCAMHHWWLPLSLHVNRVSKSWQLLRTSEFSLTDVWLYTSWLTLSLTHTFTDSHETSMFIGVGLILSFRLTRHWLIYSLSCSYSYSHIRESSSQSVGYWYIHTHSVRDYESVRVIHLESQHRIDSHYLLYGLTHWVWQTLVVRVSQTHDSHTQALISHSLSESQCLL